MEVFLLEALRNRIPFNYHWHDCNDSVELEIPTQDFVIISIFTMANSNSKDKRGSECGYFNRHVVGILKI